MERCKVQYKYTNKSRYQESIIFTTESGGRERVYLKKGQSYVSSKQGTVSNDKAVKVEKIPENTKTSSSSSTSSDSSK